MTLSAQDILQLAPDAASASAGKGLGLVRKWLSVGRDDGGDLIWGLMQGSGSKPYMTVAETSGADSKCSCPSRKFPCKHALGLWLAHAAEIVAFAPSPPPTWVAEWAGGRAKRVARAEESGAAEAAGAGSSNAATPAPPAKPRKDAAKALAKRETLVDEGVDLLTQWLADLARQGLSGLPTLARDGGLEAMARRMVDAQAPRPWTAS